MTKTEKDVIIAYEQLLQSNKLLVKALYDISKVTNDSAVKLILSNGLYESIKALQGA